MINSHKVAEMSFAGNQGKTGKRKGVVKLDANGGRRQHRMNPEQNLASLEKKNRKTSKNIPEISERTYEKSDGILVWRNPEFEPANNDDYSSTKKVA